MAQPEEHSPSKQNVPGSNPGRSLGFFLRLIIPHASLACVFICSFDKGSDLCKKAKIDHRVQE